MGADDYIYFVFGGRSGPPSGPYADIAVARVHAQASADVDGTEAVIKGVPVLYLEIAYPDGAEFSGK